MKNSSCSPSPPESSRDFPPTASPLSATFAQLSLPLMNCSLFFTSSIHLSPHNHSIPPLPVCQCSPSLRGSLQLNACQPGGCYVKLSNSLSLHFKLPISYSYKRINPPVLAFKPCTKTKPGKTGW